MKAVIDSDVLIDFLQGRDAAAIEIDRYDDPCCSVISWMEVMIGAGSDAERFAAETLFESMRRIDLSADIARRAVELRRQLRLKLPDAILLATADRESCILVTRNAKDFDADDPRVRIPYQVRSLLARKPFRAFSRRGMPDRRRPRGRVCLGTIPGIDFR